MLRLKLPRNQLAFLIDLAIALCSLPLALFLRWGRDFVIYSASYLEWATVLCACIAGLAFLRFHTYARSWRYVSIQDVIALGKASALTIFLFYLALFLINRLEMMPRSVPPIHFMLLLAGLCAPRFLWRAWHERTLRLSAKPGTVSGINKVPVILLGSGDESETFIRESLRNVAFGYRVLAVITSNASHAGRRMHDIPVYPVQASLEISLKEVLKKHAQAQRIIVADRDAYNEDMAALFALSENHGLTLAKLPKLTDFQAGSTAFELRPVDVADVLGRPQAVLDKPSMQQLLSGKRVLVTGGGGSIGSELVRQIAMFAPSELTIIESSEFALYRIHQEVQQMQPDFTVHGVLGNIRDKQQLSHIFQQRQPEVVFHAAAIKHVPIAEANEAETVLTNVIGTQHVADMCVEHNVSVMVQISTDKAVNPTNVMGACKRVAEAYCQALGESQQDTRFVTVRFGNVLGSSGSVVPLFQSQMQQGGPITVTHPEMTRYFMTIPEAVQLVIQAAALEPAEISTPSPIFVLDMGEPIKIIDLARQMIRLAGLQEGKDIVIEVTGLRPGEKLYEELFHASESLGDTPHEKIQLAHPRSYELKALRAQYTKLLLHCERNDAKALRASLHELVPEFTQS